MKLNNNNNCVICELEIKSQNSLELLNKYFDKERKKLKACDSCNKGEIILRLFFIDGTLNNNNLKNEFNIKDTEKIIFEKFRHITLTETWFNKKMIPIDFLKNKTNEEIEKDLFLLFQKK